MRTNNSRKVKQRERERENCLSLLSYVLPGLVDIEDFTQGRRRRRKRREQVVCELDEKSKVEWITGRVLICKMDVFHKKCIVKGKDEHTRGEESVE